MRRQINQLIRREEGSSEYNRGEEKLKGSTRETIITIRGTLINVTRSDE